MALGTHTNAIDRLDNALLESSYYLWSMSYCSTDGGWGCSPVALASSHGANSPTQLISCDQWLNNPTSSYPDPQYSDNWLTWVGMDLPQCTESSPPIPGRWWASGIGFHRGRGGGLFGSLMKERLVQAFPAPTDQPSFIFTQQPAPLMLLT